MWPEQTFDFVKLPEDREGFHYGLFAGEELVSVISLFQKDGKAQFRKFATEVAHQGKGYGSQLLRFVISQVLQMPVPTLWCNARLDKAAYYEKFGFRKTEITYEKGGLLFVVMERSME